jgi:aspartyl-tRNA(Asn)/glutamyl-tRNA(Gln) amidotransferase subunit B
MNPELGTRNSEQREGTSAMKYEAVIGLEVHAQMLTRSKMFCACSAKFGEAPNSQTCPVCLGLPGALPVLNRRAVELAVRTALALGCTIAPRCRFARKNYFYPDLPKNYQISQYEQPLAEHGVLEFTAGGAPRRVGIKRLHVEEDAGKLVHAGAMGRAESSLVDLNRCGVPLMEIVSEPDLRTPEEAAEYLRQLRAILMYLEVCDGNMEEGSLRCDANISLRPAGATALGVKTEVKNMNSFRNLQRALEFEIQRQTKLLDAGEPVVQETRLWDADGGITLSMRGKEEAHDYRYFPEPDLVPLAPPPEWIEQIRRSLPELPEARRARFASQYALPDYDARVLTDSRARADYFEAVVRQGADPKQAGNWVKDELLGLLNKEGKAIEESPISPERLGEMLILLKKGSITGKMAKAVFEEMYATGKAPGDIVREKGLTVMTDTGALEAILDEVIAQNPAAVAELKAGKAGSKNFLVGQVMKKTQGKADPQLVNALLTKKLAS